jgi:transposase
MAYVSKKISAKNKKERVKYGKNHLYCTVHDFWQYVFFTDEAHIDPSSQGAGYVLRERGYRLDTENIQERGEKTGVKFHIAGWCNWWAKCEKLEFYNDEETYIEGPTKPPKPRRRPTTETEEEFALRIAEWEASIGHDKEVKPKGNAMTQKYYVERLLPVYINAIHTARLQLNGELKPWILQEDNDPSHGKRKKGLAQLYLESNWIPVLIHPAQSPDLNPMEACWNILKNRVRKRVWYSLDEFKDIIQQEWAKITIAEVRARIKEMPDRCKRLVETGGAPIKSNLW